MPFDIFCYCLWQAWRRRVQKMSDRLCYWLWKIWIRQVRVPSPWWLTRRGLRSCRIISITKVEE